MKKPNLGSSEKSEPVPSKRQNLRFNTGIGRRFPSNSSSSYSLTNIHCYKCGSLGHIASNRPLKGRQSRESQRPHRSSVYNSGNNRSVNSIVAENEELQLDTERIELSKARVAELQKQLQDAEREMAMGEQTRSMHGITPLLQHYLKIHDHAF